VRREANHDELARLQIYAWQLHLPARWPIYDLARWDRGAGARRTADLRRRAHQRRVIRVYERRRAIGKSRGRRDYRAEEKRVSESRLSRALSGLTARAPAANLRHAATRALSLRLHKSQAGRQRQGLLRAERFGSGPSRFERRARRARPG